MPYNILVTSPLWIPMDRDPDWNEHVVRFDSGARQANTPWHRPLYNYNFSNRNFPRSTQSSLHAFINSQKRMTTPFLIKDPYDYLINGVLQVGSAVTIAANSGFYLVEANSYRVMPDSANLVITSALSGTLTPTTDYVTSLDNAFIKLVIGKALNDTITISGHYFRKVAFTKTSEQSFLWNQFSGSFSLEELMP